MPDQPPLRASDSDRDRAAAMLRDAFVEGRLTADEFHDRADRALAAKTIGELAELTADLPAPQPPTPSSPAVLERRRELRRIWTAWLSMAVLLNVVWLLTALTSSEVPAYWPAWPLGIVGALGVVRTVKRRTTDGEAGRKMAGTSRQVGRRPADHP